VEVGDLERDFGEIRGGRRKEKGVREDCRI